MIYLTSHRVASRRFQRTAVHSFLHRPEGLLPPDEDAHMLVDRVARNPGKLVAAVLVLPAGGNAVEAFLDVVAADQLDGPSLTSLFAEIRPRLRTITSNEFGVAGDRAYMRFYARPDLDLADTYDELALASQGLYANPTYDPLVIGVERRGDATHYALDDASVLRIRRILGSDWAAPRVRVTDDMRHDFTAVVGEIHEHLIDVCTGLDRMHVRGLGGVRFVDASSGELGRWP